MCSMVLSLYAYWYLLTFSILRIKQKKSVVVWSNDGAFITSLFEIPVDSWMMPGIGVLGLINFWKEPSSSGWPFGDKIMHAILMILLLLLHNPVVTKSKITYATC